MAENKQQHFVPQLYLRIFSENKNQQGCCHAPSASVPRVTINPDK